MKKSLSKKLVAYWKIPTPKGKKPKTKYVPLKKSIEITADIKIVGKLMSNGEIKNLKIYRI